MRNTGFCPAVAAGSVAGLALNLLPTGAADTAVSAAEAKTTAVGPPADLHRQCCRRAVNFLRIPVRFF